MSADMENPNPNPDPAAEIERHRLALRRIQRISMHLATPRPYSACDDQLDMLTCAGRAKKLDVNTSFISNYMRGKHWKIQERVFLFYESRPDLQTPVEIPKDEHRELCMRQLLALVRDAGIRPLQYALEDPDKYFAIMEAVGSVDMSLGVKLGVQYSSLEHLETSFSCHLVYT